MSKKIKIVLRDGKNIKIDRKKFGYTKKDFCRRGMQKAVAFDDTVKLKKVYYYEFLKKDFSGVHETNEFVGDKTYKEEPTEEQLLYDAFQFGLHWSCLIIPHIAYEIESEEED